MVGVRKIVLLLLCITFVAPIMLYTDRSSSFESPSTKQEFVEDVTAFAFSAADSSHLNLLPQETSTAIKAPSGVMYTEEDSINTNNLPQGLQLVESREHVSAKVLSTTTEEDQAEKENPIKLVTNEIKQGNQGSGVILKKSDVTGENVNAEDVIDVDDSDGKLTKSTHASTQEPQLKKSNAVARAITGATLALTLEDSTHEQVVQCAINGAILSTAANLLTVIF